MGPHVFNLLKLINKYLCLPQCAGAKYMLTVLHLKDIALILFYSLLQDVCGFRRKQVALMM